MAMPASTTSAKAVVGISEVHFKKWNGEEPQITPELFAANNDWFSVATIKGSVTCSQDAQSVTKVTIDQSNMPIGISTEPGDFNVEAQFPSLKSSDLQKWLSKDASSISISDSDNKARLGYGYDFNTTLKDLVMAIKTQTGDWIVFPNVKGDVAFGMEDNVWVLKFSGQVLGTSRNTQPNKSVYVFADSALEIILSKNSLEFGSIPNSATSLMTVNVKCPSCVANSLAITYPSKFSGAATISKADAISENGKDLDITFTPGTTSVDADGYVVISHTNAGTTISERIYVHGKSNAS